MNRDIFTPAERERINARRNRPPRKRFDELVKLGIIDVDGKVLVRMPEGAPESVTVEARSRRRADRNCNMPEGAPESVIVEGTDRGAGA